MIEYELPLDEDMGESFPGMTFEFPYLWIWGAIIIPQIVNKLLLIGYHRSVYDNRYYKPIVTCDNLPYYHLRGEEDLQMIKILVDTYRCAEKEEWGYEIKVRNFMSDLWVKLYDKVQDALRNPGQIQNKTDKRLKQMIAFVNSHYAEKISLEDIAEVGCISVRECIRNFKKNMQITPFQYLQQLRVESAANMLMHSDLPITEIALKNGFATSSHFTQLFKEYMHCTPKMYRNTSRQNYKQSSFTNKK